MAQGEEEEITIFDIFKSRAFAKGVADYKNGLPFNYGPVPEHFEYEYERGRQFAAWCVGEGCLVPPMRNGRRVNIEGVVLLACAMNMGDIR